MDHEKERDYPGKEREREFVYQREDTVQPVQNSDLVCATCRYALPRAGICQKFRPKPDYVLLKKLPCPAYESGAPQGSAPAPLEGDDGSSARVVHTPQCVGCAHNQGGLHCAMFVRKPEEMLLNRRPCPGFQSAG